LIINYKLSGINSGLGTNGIELKSAIGRVFISSDDFFIENASGIELSYFLIF
jgi:hypothetical protein